MYLGKYVFAQLLSFVDRYEFTKCVKRYKGNRHTRELDCWNQFVLLFFRTDTYAQLVALDKREFARTPTPALPFGHQTIR